MDTLQLNKINELAREYLRLGIAKGTSDAVEKARFQLAFEQKKEAPTESPYESLFAKEQSEQPQQRQQSEPQERRDVSPLDIKTTRFDAIEGRVGTLENDTRATLKSQQARIAQLEENLTSLQRELSMIKAKQLVQQPAPAPQAQAVEAPAQDGPIASTIEQTIKGRTISSEDVSVDKIFYFGNR